MTDFAGLRPSMESMSLRGVERLPYADAPPDEPRQPGSMDTFEHLAKSSTRPLSPVTDVSSVLELPVTTKPKKTVVGRLFCGLCFSRGG